MYKQRKVQTCEKNSEHFSNSFNNIFVNWANPGLFFIFRLYKTHITNFTINRYVKKCPFSKRCHDSNSRPLEHESPLITTRPGLPPNSFNNIDQCDLNSLQKIEKSIHHSALALRWFSLCQNRAKSRT